MTEKKIDIAKEWDKYLASLSYNEKEYVCETLANYWQEFAKFEKTLLTEKDE